MSKMSRSLWKNASYKLIINGVIMSAGIVIGSSYFNVADKRISSKLIAYFAILVFVVFGILFLHTFTSVIYKLIAHRGLGVGRAAAIMFILRVIGYLIILFGGLGLMNISVAKLLLGGAILGIILGVAAQQALANFFASVILIITHPYRVGERVVIVSGSFGGRYEGTIADIGLTHTKLRQKDGQIVYMPNSTLLSWSAIIPDRQHKKH